VVATTGATSEPTLPPLGDVLLYRGDAAAEGAQPGPAPSSKPELAWRVDVGPTHMVPILVGGALIVGTTDGKLVALDARSGATRWTYQADGGILPSLASAGGLVFASDGTAVHAIDVATGQKRWASPIGDVVGRLNAVDGVLYVGSVGAVVGFDVATGHEVWRWRGPDVAIGAGPIADGVGYFATRDGRVFAIDLATKSERWRVQTISNDVASGQVVGDTFYVSTNQGEAAEPVGEVYAIDRLTGTIRWRFRAPSGLQLKEGPVKDGVLFASGRQDGIYALRDEGSSARVVWHVDAPEAHWPMAIVGDTLFEVRTDGSVGAYATADGSLLWATDPQGDWAGGPIVSGGMVFLDNDSKGVMAFADPGLIALLPRPVAQTSPSPTLTAPVAAVPNPFRVVATLDPSFTGLVKPWAMAFGPDGNLYVVDLDQKIHVISPNGKPVRTWGTQGAGPGQLAFSDGEASIAVDASGLVYVGESGNHRVEVFRPDGQFVRSIGSFGQGPGRFVLLFNMLVDPAGDVFVVDDSEETVQKFDPSGKFVWMIGGSGETDPDLVGHFHVGGFDSKGRLWLGNDDLGRLVAIDVAGHKVDAFGEPGNGPGHVANVCSIAIDGNDNAYVNECSGTRLRVFDPHHRLIGEWSDPQDLPFGFPYVFGPDHRLYAIAGNDRAAAGPPQTSPAEILVMTVSS
jgi:outer membrane protein assembly factor BamB